MKVNALLATILFLGAHNAFATTNEVVISSDCDTKQEIITLIDEITPVRICGKKFSLLKEKETQKKFLLYILDEKKNLFFYDFIKKEDLKHNDLNLFYKKSENKFFVK